MSKPVGKKSERCRHNQGEADCPEYCWTLFGERFLKVTLADEQDGLRLVTTSAEEQDRG